MSRLTLTLRGGLGPAERTLRIAAGFALALFALATVHSLSEFNGLAVWASLGAVLVGIGVVATGVGGYCPLYARLGFGRPRANGGPWYGKG
jgi:hypothetical protein